MNGSRRMTVRDLVLIGVLTTLLAVVSMGAGMLTMPLMSFALIASSAISALVTAPIYLLMAFKVAKPGVMFLHAVLLGILDTFMGFPHMFIILIPMGLLAELVMMPSSTYRDIRRNTVSWAVFNAGYCLHGAVLLWVFGGQYFATATGSMFSPEQLALMNIYYFRPEIVLAIMLLTAVGSVIGCIIGWRMLKRHFLRAGLVQGGQVV